MAITGEILIRRPVDVVFDYVDDQTNEPEHNSSMVRAEKVTIGPVGVGTTFRSAVRSGGRTAEMLIRITAYDRPVLLASTTTTRQADIADILRFGPDPGGDLQREFPDRKGWSRSNLLYVRRVAEVWPGADEFVHHVGGRSPWRHVLLGLLLARTRRASRPGTWAPRART